MSGRLVLVATSPRTPPGILSWPAWEALRRGPVLVRDAEHPQAPFLRAAGVELTVAPTPDPTALVARAAAGEVVVWLSAGDPDTDFIRAVGLETARRGVELHVVYGSHDPPGARLLDVVAVMDRLRSPGGCPWDAAQTHASLKGYLIEETYEAYQALEDGDPVALREELGDVLLQVAFHARLAEELPGAERWTIDDVAVDLVDKLVRRHPHVFADRSVADAAELERTWEESKAQEKGRTSVTDGVPLSLPSLALAAKLQRRAARLGVPDVPLPAGPGGELWSLVGRLSSDGVDAEEALRAAARHFRDQLAAIETAVRRQGGDPATLTPEEWRGRWAEADG